MCNSLECGHKRADMIPLTAPRFNKAFAILAMALPDEMWEDGEQELARHLSELADKDMRLWGPEAFLLRNRITAEWESLFGKLLQDIVNQFNIPTDINAEVSINTEKVSEILQELSENAGKLYKKTQKFILVVLNALYEKSISELESDEVPVVSEVKRSDASDAWQKVIATAMRDHLKDAFGQFPEKVIGEYVNKLISEHLQFSIYTYVDRIALMDRLEILKALPANYFDSLTDVAAGRVWSFAALQQFREKGINCYKINGIIDGKTCEVCHMLNGKVFSVECLMEKMAAFLNNPTDDDLAKAQFPFPRFKDLDNREVKASEGHLPPLHVNSLIKGTEVYTLSRGWVKIEKLDTDDVCLSLYQENGTSPLMLGHSKVAGTVCSFSKKGVGFILAQDDMIQTTEEHDIPMVHHLKTPQGMHPTLSKLLAKYFINSRLSAEHFGIEIHGTSLLVHPPLGAASGFASHEGVLDKNISPLDYWDTGVIRTVPLGYDEHTEFRCVELEEHHNLLVRSCPGGIPMWVGNCRCNVTLISRTVDRDGTPIPSPTEMQSRIKLPRADLLNTKELELAARKISEKLITLDGKALTTMEMLSEEAGKDIFKMSESQVADAKAKVLTHNHVDTRSVSKDDLKLLIDTQAKEIRTVTSGKVFSLKVKWIEALGEGSSFSSVEALKKAVLRVYDKNLSTATTRAAKRLTSGELTKEAYDFLITDSAMKLTAAEYPWMSYSGSNLE